VAANLRSSQYRVRNAQLRLQTPVATGVHTQYT
jgi:hypothetical protein